MPRVYSERSLSERSLTNDLGIEHFHYTTKESSYLFKIIHNRKQKYYTGVAKYPNKGIHWSARGKVYPNMSAVRRALDLLVTDLAEKYPDDNIVPENLGVVAIVSKPYCYIPAEVFGRHRDGVIAANMYQDYQKVRP